MANPNGHLIHGYARIGRVTPEWRCWASIKTRCTNPRYSKYKDYGGRGIKVCEEWMNSFETFLKHIGPRPSSRHTIERIDNDGNYEPGNVRWATRKEQSANQRVRHTSHFVTWNGKRVSLAQLAKETGFNYNTLRARAFDGWPDDRLTEPVTRKRRA